MVEKLIYNRESSQAEQWISVSSNNVSPDVYGPVYTSSKKLLEDIEDICSKHFTFLDIIRTKSNPSCRENLSVLFDYISVHMNLALHCADLVEHGSSKFSSNSYRTASLCNIMASLDFFGSLESHRRSEFIAEYNSFSRPANVVMSPPVQWTYHSATGTARARNLMTTSLSRPANMVISHPVQWSFDSPTGMVIARTPMKGHSLVQLGTVDHAKDQFRTISSNERETNLLEFTASKSSICKAPLAELQSEASLIDKQISEMNKCEKIPASYADESLTFLYESSPTANCSVMKGQLKCQWKSDTPYFVFTVGDDCSEVYLCSPLKIESSVTKGLDYMYLFHSRSVNKLESGNYGTDSSDILGKMKVSNFLILNSDGSRTMETEFVLFGVNANNPLKMQSSDSIIKSRGLRKKVTDILKPNHPYKHQSTRKFDELSTQFDILPNELCLSMFRNCEERDLVNQLENDCTPDLELAAVVLKDHRQDSNREAASGGWGLKFLGRSTANDVDSSSDPSFSFVTCKESPVIDIRKYSKKMTVLVPAGYHGGPRTKDGGPSGLIKRWRSGGHCDCGGWDVGCSLQVLSCSSIVKDSKALLREVLQDDGKSVDLFIEGTKNTEPVMKMVERNNGCYIIYFQPTLSAVQTFSIGVAIIHSQSSALAPHF